MLVLVLEPPGETSVTEPNRVFRRSLFGVVGRELLIVERVQSPDSRLYNVEKEERSHAVCRCARSLPALRWPIAQVGTCQAFDYKSGNLIFSDAVVGGNLRPRRGPGVKLYLWVGYTGRGLLLPFGLGVGGSGHPCIIGGSSASFVRGPQFRVQ